jgi:hypothetical protein
VAVFRKINTSFWQDPLVLDLTPEEKYFYLYLMTNTKTNQCGIYEIPKKVMEMETGYNRETVDKLINRFVDYGKIIHSQDTNEIMIVNWIKYNGSTSPKVISRVESELKEIKNKDLVKKYLELCSEYNYHIDTVSLLYPYSIDTQSQKEEEEEKEEEREKETKPIKTKYGEFQKVKLTEEEHSKLISRLGEIKTRDLIDRLDNYKESTGKSYKSDYATILNWHRREAKDESRANSTNGRTKEEGEDLARRAGVTSL